ncbi:MAG TPA: CoA transferase [Xanthobacteraceae bacterium]|jgi:crotonobetainyl-CoA:carnitine CoA-transferase CaiB-like acyl-CoA transferase|nr:CoA transferase [Xanthobacteraceae bacterium]
MSALDPADVLVELWRDAELDDEALYDAFLTGAEPVLPSSFPVGTAAQATIGATALAAAELWRLRTERRQRVRVEMRNAAIEFRSERYLRVDGKDPDDHHDAIAGLYRCGDGRWARLHTNLPHHRDGLLKLLGCDHDKRAVQRALEHWPAESLETAAAEAGLVVTACRSFAEWDGHLQGRAIANLPLFSIDKIGDAPRLKLTPAERPLSGIKVLDLTRIIAGPVCGRALAGHGAEVLLVTAAHLPSMLPLVIDTGRGKLSAAIDLRQSSGRETLAQLVRQADVFVQGYRPGAVAAHGFSAEEVARLRPGIIYASLSAYGHEGPWAYRRGFDSLVQTASGLNLAEAEAFGSPEPRALPAQALDHATGYLLAFAIMAALQRRAEQGGSWHVRVSLAQTGYWLRQLGRIDGVHCRDPGFDDVRDRLQDAPSGFGVLTAVRHAAEMSETPPHWARPSVPLGTHAPGWGG